MDPSPVERRFIGPVVLGHIAWSDLLSGGEVYMAFGVCVLGAAECCGRQSGGSEEDRLE